MTKQTISTELVPKAIGPYSQAIKVNQTVYLSGQIPLIPETMELVSQEFKPQAIQVFKNLTNLARASGGSLKDVVKLNIYLTDLKNFDVVNKIMQEFMHVPYPARAAIGVNQLPRGALVEIDGILELE